MIRNKFVVPILAVAGIAGLELGWVSFASAQTPGKAAPSKAKASGITPAQVESMIKAGLSEDLIAAQIKKQAKPVDLSPDQMVQLKNAGATDRIIALMLDPAHDPGPTAAAPAPTPAPAAAPPPEPAPVPVADAGPPPAPVATAGKKRLAVEEFDYSTVKTAVQQVFGTTQDIGKGIRAMLVVRLNQAGKFTIVERAKVNDILKEQDFGASNRVKQGSNARIGRIKGADALLEGDIVIFGRDDKKKGGAAAAALPGVLGGLSKVHKEDKAVVAINFRLVDAETSEVIATAEARGESKRSSNNWGALGLTGKAAGAGNVDMTSSDFAETIIGEATQDCVNKLADQLNAQAVSLKSRQVDVETRVADATPNTLILAAGSNDGVQVGDRFEIGRIVREVKDPTTKETIDVVTQKLGELVITAVRDRSSSGNYSGQPAKINDYAKKL